MTRNAPHFLPVLIGLLLSAIMLAAQSANPGSISTDNPTRVVNYSGRMPDSAAFPPHSVRGMTFAVYRDETGGAPVWMETQNVTVDESGRYSVLLGSTTSGIPVDLFPSDEQRWLGVRVESEPELPRVLLTSVPYAVTSSNADKLGGHPASDFLLTSQLPRAGVAGLLPSFGTGLSTSPQAANGMGQTTGTQDANYLSKFASGGNLTDSAVFESNGLVGIGTTNPTQTLQINGSILMFGQATHQISLTGVASSGRLGQDLFGPFLSSDTPGKAIRFVTSGIKERVRITDSGNMGIATPNPTATLEIAGPVKISGTGNGLTFPDGTTQLTASQLSLKSNVFTGKQEAPSLVADTSTVIGSSPGTNGQVAIMPDNLDTVHQYWGQAGQNVHFRLSSAQPGPDGGQDFIIAPYAYGMAMEYAGVLEAWVNDFSVHFNQRNQKAGTPARFWVGDEHDTGGLFVTAFDNGGGSNSYTVLAADRFSHAGHGSLVFQVRDPADAYKFQWGPYNSEVTRASISNTATATNLNLMYGSVQGTVTADTNNNGAINLGSVSTTPVNLVVGSAPKLTVFPDGNVSIGNAQDSARLSVGSTGLFSVTDSGAMTAASLNLTSSLTLSGSLAATNINASGTVTAGTVNAGTLSTNSLTSTSIATPTMSAGSVTATATNTGTLNATTATANSLNSTAIATASLTLGNGTPIVGHLSVTAFLDFAPIPPNSCTSQSVAVSGASDGDTVALGIPGVLGAVDGVTWFGWVSASGTVSLRGCNAMLTATVDPPAATVRIDVWEH